MKFAKDLDEELVPEWRAKYLDYKAGKKKVRAIGRAIQKSNRTSLTPSLQLLAPEGGDRPVTFSHGPPSIIRSEPADTSRPHEAPAGGGNHATPIPRSAPAERHERQPFLRGPDSGLLAVPGSYGSIIATPPQQHSMGSDMGSINLPDPAIDPKEDALPVQNNCDQKAPKAPSPVVSRRDTASNAPVPQETGNPPDRNPSSVSRKGKRGSLSGPSAKKASEFLKRVFSHQDWEPREKLGQGSIGSGLERRQDEFFSFLDDELHKIESFYQMKETEATQRLQALRQQLHIMRDRRIQEVLASSKARRQKVGDNHQPRGFGLNGNRLKDAIKPRNRAGKDPEALAQLATPGPLAWDAGAVASQRDFSRRPESQSPEVPYRSAKRKLKYALQEFYRGLELLKSYAYLNRTAFRKINKKYDKVIHALPPMKYMTDNVNEAWFVQSEVVEDLMNEVEDLYARYFERGNHKIAVSKLRRSAKKSGDYSQNSFCSGLLLMAGLLFGVQALVYAGQHINHGDSSTRLRTGYLLQLYGGFFLVVFHFLLFCLDCMIWTKSRINYVFVFEFDSRHALDWRQLLELPSFFLFLLGLFMWVNFRTIDVMYIYWPIVLIGLTVIILFLPSRLLYHRARKWWAFSNWRLLLAGMYPVEFRDFFLGDMYCSQTYSMGNIELFFCLYATHWTNLPKCNSSHSRLFGFFQCLPAVWRAFQCLRRFSDTRNIFPHLVNFGKYIFTILYYATLSMYRIDKHARLQAAFIAFALLNAVYCSVWDIAMDWSLCNPYTKSPLLRDVLAFRRPWVYYTAMVLDIIVRFNWIFYAIFTHNIGHAAVLSFVISFSEVCRRGMWSIFRVENEHCTNVILFRASRDVPLPYELPRLDGQTDAETDQPAEAVQLQDQPVPTTSDVEHGRLPTPAILARGPSLASGISRVGEMVASAHAQDFERRKHPVHMHGGITSNDPNQSPADSSEEEDDDEDSPYNDDIVAEELPFSNVQAWNASRETGLPSMRS